jgi:hypothetical protein
MHVLQVLISTLWIYYEPLVYYGIIPLSSNIDSKYFPIGVSILIQCVDPTNIYSVSTVFLILWQEC